MAKATLTHTKKREWIDKGPALSKKDVEDKVRKTFYIKHSAYQKLRRRAFDEEVSMSKVINEILEKTL